LEQKGDASEEDWPGVVQNALEKMKGEGVKLSLIMSPPLPSNHTGNSNSVELLKEMARSHPGRFEVMGGGSSLNPMIDGTPAGEVTESVRREFEKTAEDLLKQGAIGFGEMSALHFFFNRTHPFEETQPDHPLFLLLADIAARRGVPIDLHMEAVSEDIQTPDEFNSRSSNNPDTVSENISAFERLLAHNPKAKIVWVHVGMDSTDHRSPALTRRLLAKYPNLYLSITGFRIYTKKHKLIQKGRGLNLEWRAVINEFPDRFMIGSDSFYLPPQSTIERPDTTARAMSIFKFLPPRIARMISYQNAQRVYGLNVVREPKERPGGSPRGHVKGGAQGGDPPPQTAKGGKSLTEAEVRRRIIGNTIYFKAPRGNRKLYVYFAKGGAVAVKAEGKPGRVVSKRWSFKKKGNALPDRWAEKPEPLHEGAAGRQPKWRLDFLQPEVPLQGENPQGAPVAQIKPARDSKCLRDSRNLGRGPVLRAVLEGEVDEAAAAGVFLLVLDAEGDMDDIPGADGFLVIPHPEPGLAL
jgi:hypothetical protein